MARKRFYNDKIIEVETYDVDSIKDIKPGEEFAAIVNKNDIFDILPCVDIKKDGAPDVWFNKINSLSCLESDIFNNGVILVFKKVADNIATELLTGKNFVINGYKNDEIDEDYYDSRDVEHNYNNIKKYGDNPVLISCYSILKYDVPCKNMYYKVKGDIARYYEEETKNKDTLKETLIELLSTARANYKEHLQKCIDGIKEIADKENEEYDEKNGRSSIK